MGNILIKKMKFASLPHSSLALQLSSSKVTGSQLASHTISMRVPLELLRLITPLRLTGMSTPSSPSRLPRMHRPLLPLHPRLLLLLMLPLEPPSPLPLLTSPPLHTRLRMISLPRPSLWREDREISIPHPLPRLLP